MFPVRPTTMQCNFWRLKLPPMMVRIMTFVTLRKHHVTYPRQVDFDAYRQYHLEDNNNNPDLHFYHHWDSKNRSDEPETTRRSFAFNEALTAQDQHKPLRKLLTISYHTSAGRVTCVPFYLGPDLASFVTQDVGDEVVLELPFIIEISEAKTAAGQAGGTFVLQSSGH